MEVHFLGPTGVARPLPPCSQQSTRWSCVWWGSNRALCDGAAVGQASLTVTPAGSLRQKKPQRWPEMVRSMPTGAGLGERVQWGRGGGSLPQRSLVVKAMFVASSPCCKQSQLRPRVYSCPNCPDLSSRQTILCASELPLQGCCCPLSLPPSPLLLLTPDGAAMAKRPSSPPPPPAARHPRSAT